MDQEKDRQTDEMLDSLLANYSSAEPRPGLETRILANLREAEKKAPQGWWNFKWIWAGAVAAAVVIAMVLVNVRHQVTPPTNTVLPTMAGVGTSPPAGVSQQDWAMFLRMKQQNQFGANT